MLLEGDNPLKNIRIKLNKKFDNTFMMALN